VIVPRAIFSLSGPDACRYLNGQVTQDVTAIPPGCSAAACLTNHKGKLDAAPAFIHHLAAGCPGGDSGATFLFDAPLELRDTLATRLGRYLVADDCELADVTESFELYHSPATPTAPGTPVHGAPNRWRFGFGGGTDRIVHAGSGDAPEAGGAALTPPQAELQRVRCGLPDWGSELDPETLPAEAGLDTFAVSFTKGCYVGQEVVSRIRSVGRVNRRLHLLTPVGALPQDLASRLPLDLYLPGAAATGERPVGTLTSVAGGADGAFALGYLRRGTPTGCLLQVGSTETMLTCQFEPGPVAPRLDPAPLPASQDPNP
jgi:folate-binding protein YgfZ